MMTAKEMVRDGKSVLVIPLDGTGENKQKLDRALVGAGMSPEAPAETEDTVIVVQIDRSEDGGETWSNLLSSPHGALMRGNLRCFEICEYPEPMLRDWPEDMKMPKKTA